MKVFATVLLFVLALAAWLVGNVWFGNVAALDYVALLPLPITLLLAVVPSAGQLYITEHWRNPDSLIARSWLFSIGAALLTALDLAGPALGLLISTGHLLPWSWAWFAGSLVAAFLLSWWAQHTAWTLGKRLWTLLRAQPRGRSKGRRNGHVSDVEELTLQEAR